MKNYQEIIDSAFNKHLGHLKHEDTTEFLGAVTYGIGCYGEKRIEHAINFVIRSIATDAERENISKLKWTSRPYIREDGIEEEESSLMRYAVRAKLFLE